MFFLLKTDEQSEVSNQKMEKYFCIYVNNQQNNWFDKLFIAEFAANNNNSVATKSSLFFFKKLTFMQKLWFYWLFRNPNSWKD